MGVVSPEYKALFEHDLLEFDVVLHVCAWNRLASASEPPRETVLTRSLPALLSRVASLVCLNSRSRNVPRLKSAAPICGRVLALSHHNDPIPCAIVAIFFGNSTDSH